jgi:dihydroorotate dehydrogenase
MACTFRLRRKVRSVSVGTAWLVDPGIFLKIHSGMKKYLKKHGKKISDLTGVVHRT